MADSDKGKAYAARRRRRAWAQAFGIPHYGIDHHIDEFVHGEGPGDARHWGTNDGRIIMLPFATEDKSRPGHWFVSVLDADQDAVIVLCEEGGSCKIYAVELFADFIERFWDRLTERRGEVVLNIEREGGFFFVRVPNVDRVRAPATGPFEVPLPGSDGQPPPRL